MDSNEFILKKFKTSIFKKHFEKLKKNYAGKKVLIYGAGWAFEELSKKFGFGDFNVIGISDIKFKEQGEFCGFNSIPPNSIKETDFDVIFMTLYYPEKAIKALTKSGQIVEDTEIEHILKDQIIQESEFVHYLDKIKFEKHLNKLAKKLKDKKIVIYGTGAFFETINEYFNLSNLNIIALSDRKFLKHKKNEKFFGYLVCAPEEIEDFNPDYVLVATKYFINIIEDLEENVIKDKKVKFLPLIKKPFMELFREIWN